jgi:hypothetical protein
MSLDTEMPRAVTVAIGQRSAREESTGGGTSVAVWAHELFFSLNPGNPDRAITTRRPFR